MTTKRRVLVTGAGGYIGRHVVRALLDEGADVIGVGRSLEPGVVDERAVTVRADVLADDPEIFTALGSPDTLVHLAWRDGFNHRADSHLADLSAHYRFISRMVDSGVSHVAVLGTMHEIGYWEGAVDETTPTAPQSLYGIAKDSLRRALTVRLLGDQTVFQWLRSYYIFGDDENNHSIFTHILRAVERGDTTFPFTLGKNKVDFIRVEALGDQIAAAVLQDEVVGVINTASGRPVELGAHVQEFLDDNGFDLQLEYGAFPERPYDSPAIWGSTAKIDEILAARARASR